MLKIRRDGVFRKTLKELIQNDTSIETLVERKIELFAKNPEDTRLENHSLRKRFKGKWAFSITSDIRIVYKWIGKTTVRFLSIGPHKDVYQ